MRALLIGIAITLSGNASAQTQDEVTQAGRDAFQMAQSFSQCAGFWDFWSAVEQASGNSATSQNAHNKANGARISAGYTMSLRNHLLRPDEAPRSYGSWDEFIEPLAEVTTTQMMAALEQGDTASVQEQAVTCRGVAEASQDIIDEIRQEQAY